MNRPRILLVTIHACRMPGSGGNVRAHFFTRAAANLGDLTVLSLCGATGQQFDQDLQKICDRVISRESVREAERPPKKVSSALGLIATPWRRNWSSFVASCVQHCSGAPATQEKDWRKRCLSQVLDLEHSCLLQMGLLPPMACLTWFQEYRNLRPEVLRAEAERPFDALWVEDVFSWPFAADLLRSLRSTPKSILCNTYNVESSVAERMAETATDQRASAIARRNSRQLAAMEQRAYSTSGLTFVCSKEDRDAAQRLAPQGRFEVVGNGVDLSYFRTDRQQEQGEMEPLLLLTGTFGYGPNLQAAEFFASKVMPIVKLSIPAARFMIAGGQAAGAAAQLADAGLDVESVNNPADIRPSFRRAALFVVPLLSGGGTRLKILEAMAMGVPVVSTTVGAEGLGAEAGQQLLLADSPAELAAAVIQLLRSPEIADRMRERAAVWVRQHYDWQSLCRAAELKAEEFFASSWVPGTTVGFSHSAQTTTL